VERTIAETALLLRDEQEVLEGAIDETLARLGEGAVSVAEVRRLPAGLARLVLRRLAGDAAGCPRPLSRADAEAVLSLGERGGSRSLDLGGGLAARVEYGALRFTREPDAEPGALAPVPLLVPGAVRFGAWEVEARLVDAVEDHGAPDERPVSAALLGPAVTVRAWHAGDRMRPIGLSGSKSLQDIFTDRKVPRGLRRTLPVVEAQGEIVWVAGVAVSERFVEAATIRDQGESHPLVRLSARSGPA
jgi:tRNA(Ile)-lysidine synthase